MARTAPQSVGQPTGDPAASGPRVVWLVVTAELAMVAAAVLVGLRW